MIDGIPFLCTECGSTKLSILASDRAGVKDPRHFLNERPTLSKPMKTASIHDIINRLQLNEEEKQCLSQVCQEEKLGESAGYAKLETFPIWNLPLNHPVNIAYEGMRCSSAEVKRYAFGRADGSWGKARNAAWTPISYQEVNRQHHMLHDDLFCPNGMPVAGNSLTSEPKRNNAGVCPALT